jgi:hypothetical protein
MKAIYSTVLLISTLFLFSCGESEEILNARIHAKNYATKMCDCNKMAADASEEYTSCIEESNRHLDFLINAYDEASEAGISVDDLKKTCNADMAEISSKCPGQ